MVLTEVDRLTKDAQHSLRRTMEKYTATCRLILCCNSTSKVIPAIRSRCLGVRVAAPSTEEVMYRCFLGDMHSQIRVAAPSTEEVMYRCFLGDMHSQIRVAAPSTEEVMYRCFLGDMHSQIRVAAPSTEEVMYRCFLGDMHSQIRVAAPSTEEVMYRCFLGDMHSQINKLPCTVVLRRNFLIFFRCILNCHVEFLWRIIVIVVIDISKYILMLHCSSSFFKLLSDEGTHLPSMWSKFNCWSGHHVRVEYYCGWFSSWLWNWFLPGHSDFPLSAKPNISKF